MRIPKIMPWLWTFLNSCQRRTEGSRRVADPDIFLRLRIWFFLFRIFTRFYPYYVSHYEFVQRLKLLIRNPDLDLYLILNRNVTNKRDIVQLLDICFLLSTLKTCGWYAKEKAPNTHFFLNSRALIRLHIFMDR